MSNEKDTQRIGENSYGQQDVRNNEALANKSYSNIEKPVYEFANKKTEKLVTALYMITDCMDTDDAIKAKLRSLGVSLLSDMYKLHILSPVEKSTHIAIAFTRIGEIVAFVEIAHAIGFVSEMNARILKKEFNILIAELHSYKKENEHSSFGGSLFENQKMSGFVLNEKLFEVENNFPEINKALSPSDVSEALSYRLREDYRTDNRTSNMSHTNRAPFMSFRKENPQSSKLVPKEVNKNKEDRSIKILELIKGKKEVSIKDISAAFTDCSEKTIQRELNSLAYKGQIKKIGSKRWSRYQYI